MSEIESKFKMDGREHHALDDAIHQAKEIAATLDSLTRVVGDPDA